MSTLLKRGMGIKVAALVLAIIVVSDASTARAAGNGYFTSTSCAGCSVGPNGVGAVVALYEFVDLPGTSQGHAIRTTILDVLVFEDGWTYQIKKDGGIDSAIEVIFENATCIVKFKSKVEPGKTKIDHGAVRCK